MKIQTQYGEVHVLTNCPLLNSTERLEFKTEVHEAYDSSEDRYIQRDAPRQVLSFNYVNMQKAMGDMFHMLYANLRKQWGIPLPQFRQLIPDLDDSDYIPLSTAAHIADLRVGFALIESTAGFQVVEIITVGRYIITQEEIRDPETDEIFQALEMEYQDGFRLAQNVTVSNASIMPLRICIIDGDASTSTGGFWSSSSVVFRILAEDSPEHSGDVPEQYHGEDIYFKPLLLDGSALEKTLMQHQNIVDADVGGFQQFTHWKKPRYLKPFKSVLKGWNLYSEYRRFLFRRMGRYQAFWMPLYEKHLNILNTGNITTSLSTNTKYLLEADRMNIAVKRKDGTWTAHEITVKTGGSLTVSPSINTHRNDIQTICYLGLHRFDADQIEFQFLGAQITQVTVPTQVLDAEGNPMFDEEGQAIMETKSYQDQWLNLGLMLKGGVHTLITTSTANTFTLYRQHVGLAVGDVFSVVPGCDQSKRMCDEKFNNWARYAGHQFIPNSNPIYTQLIK